jgi:RNA polymerase sigma factor (TIGR02999 family)
MTPPSSDITRLLVQWKNGDPAALADLMPLVHGELRQLARSYLRHERRDHTLQPTALVNELFLRLASSHTADWQDRAHFFGIAARLMRQILVTHARQRGALKRGGDAERVDLEQAAEPAADELDLTALDAAMTALAEQDPRQARIVELRFFGGYTIKETAEIAGCSPATVSREWELARIWLFREIRRS